MIKVKFWLIFKWVHFAGEDAQKRNEKKVENENKYYQSKTYVNGD